MFKNLKHIYWIYAIVLISFFTLLPVSFAITSTSWQELGSAFPFTYTSATSNIQNSNVQLVIGFVNGIIEYYNPSTQTWINIPSPALEGGTAVTALSCGWSNTTNADGTINSNVPDVLAGYADGSVWYYQANQNGSGAWSSLGMPNSNEQVTKFGGVSIDSKNNFTGCNAETAAIPQDAVTPAGYQYKQLWTYNGANWSMLLQDDNNITCIYADMSAGSGTDGLSSGDIQQNGDYDANVSSNQINAVAYLGQNNSQNEYFYGDTKGSYGIGYFGSLNAITNTTCLGVIGDNYTYTSVSPVVNENQSVIVADSAIQLFNITNNYSTVNSAYPACWQELPSGVSFNGLYVDWNGTTPQTIIAGLTNGQILLNLGIPGYALFNAPSNFPADGTGCSQTFANPTSTGSSVAEIFNNGNTCYIYTTNIAVPPAPTAQNIWQDINVPQFTDGTADINLNNYISFGYNGSLTSFTYDTYPNNPAQNPEWPAYENPSDFNWTINKSTSVVNFWCDDANAPFTFVAYYSVATQLGQTATGMITINFSIYA